MNKLYEKLELVGVINPQTITVTEVFTGVVDMSKYLDVLAIFAGGNMAADGTQVYRAVTCDSAGNNAAALKTAAEIAVNADNKQVMIEVTNEDLAGGATNKDRYIKFGAVSAGSGGPISCVVLGVPKLGPATQPNTVVEVEIDKD